MITENPFRNFKYEFRSYTETKNKEGGLYLVITHPDFPNFAMANRAEFTDKFLRIQKVDNNHYLDDMTARLFERMFTDLTMLMLHGVPQLVDSPIDDRMLQIIAYDQEKQKWFGLNPETKEIIYEKN